MLTGREYVESLRDGRDVWYSGERVDSVPDHPILKRCVENRAREYDLHRDSAYRDALQVATPSGETHCIVYHNPQSAEDLVRYRRALEIALREAGGNVADHMHFGMEGGPSIIVRALGLMRTTMRDALPAEHRQNLENYYAYCLRSDITMTVAHSEVKGDKSKPPWEQEQYLQVVNETDRGLVLRGLRKISTGLAHAHDVWVGSNADLYRRGGLPPGEAQDRLKGKFFIFSVPLNTPGVKVVCRPAEVPAHASRVDFPAAWHDEIDGMVVFDDVVVPWERVFCYGNPEFLRAYGPESGLGEYAHCISTLSRLELLVGSAYLMAQYNGETDSAAVQAQIAELLVLRSSIWL